MRLMLVVVLSCAFPVQALSLHPSAFFDIQQPGDIFRGSSWGDGIGLTESREVRNFAEFNASNVSLPITHATLSVAIYSLQIYIFPLSPGQNPQGLDVYGYLGDGTGSASDWNAGTYISTVSLAGATDGQTLRFDVTDFVKNNRGILGFAIRANSIGYLSLNNRPDLNAVLTIVPEATSAVFLCMGALLSATLVRRTSALSANGRP